MKKIQIGELRTIVRIETNLQKVLYGSGKLGAGFLDNYQVLKTIRGNFKQFTGRRVLASGAVTFVQMYKLIVRFDIEISNAIDKQMRFIINGKVYTLDNFSYDEENKQTVIIFMLNLYSK
jgi:hypothetical protein